MTALPHDHVVIPAQAGIHAPIVQPSHEPKAGAPRGFKPTLQGGRLIVNSPQTSVGSTPHPRSFHLNAEAHLNIFDAGFSRRLTLTDGKRRPLQAPSAAVPARPL